MSVYSHPCRVVWFVIPTSVARGAERRQLLTGRRIRALAGAGDRGRAGRLVDDRGEHVGLGRPEFLASPGAQQPAAAEPGEERAHVGVAGPGGVDDLRTVRGHPERGTPRPVTTEPAAPCVTATTLTPAAT